MNEFGELPEEHDLPPSWNARKAALMTKIQKQQHDKPRYLRRSIVTAAAAIAVVAGVAAVGGETWNRQTSTATAPSNTSNVLANSKLAASTKRDVIVHQTTVQTRTDGRAADGKTESWTDRNDPNNDRFVNYRPDGSVRSDSGSISRDGIITRRSVDYDRRRVINSSGPSPSDQFFSLDFLKGDATTVGTEFIGGIAATHYLTQSNGVAIDVWISDDGNLLPLRSITKTAGLVMTTDFEWLPRSEAAISAFLPEAPAGFAIAQEDLIPTASTMPAKSK